MNAEFNETTFAFAMTQEIYMGRNSRFRNFNTVLPTFPSLREEGKVGYDIKHESKIYALFLQYKLSELCTRSISREWIDHRKPYYRFKLWKKNISNQHNILWNLSKTDKNHVYYCTPAFITRKELEEALQNGKLIEKSAFINAKSLNIISDNAQHYVTFEKVSKNIFQHSFSQECENINSLTDDSFQFKDSYSGKDEFISSFKNAEWMVKNSTRIDSTLCNLGFADEADKQIFEISNALLRYGIQLILFTRKDT